MDQLLKITTTNATYELTLTPAILKRNPDTALSGELNTLVSPTVKDNTPPEIRSDSYNLRTTVNASNASTTALNTTPKGQNGSVVAPQQITQALQTDDNRPTAGAFIAQKMLDQAQSVTIFYPNGSTELSWQVGELQSIERQTNANISDATNASKPVELINSQNLTLDYTPAEIVFRLIEKAQITIQYMGGPVYVPPSADPDFEEIPTR